MPKPQIIKLEFTGGVNLLDDPRSIADNELVYAKNVFPTANGKLAKRGAVGFVRDIGGASDGTYPLIAHLPPFPESPAEAIIVSRLVNPANQPAATSWTADTVLSVLTGESSVAIQSSLGVVTAYRPGILSFLNKTYVFPGHPYTAAAGKIVQVNAGAATGTELVDFNFAGTGNVGFSPQGACIYRKRMVFWGLGQGYENYLVFSDPYEPTVVGDNCRALNGRAISIANSDGDRIVACVEIMLAEAGTPAAAALLVLKQYSAYLLQGEPTTVSAAGMDAVSTGNLSIARMNVNAGCVSPETICKTPYGLIWAGPDDVWFMPIGGLPYAVGTKIRPALIVTSGSYKYLWHAAYFNGVYRLAIGAAGQGMDHDSACGEQWWLDLRGGAPQNFREARWWGPQIFNLYYGTETAAVIYQAGTRTMVADTRSWKDSALYGVEFAGAVSGSYYYSTVSMVNYDRPHHQDVGAMMATVTSAAGTIVRTAADGTHVNNKVTVTLPYPHSIVYNATTGNYGYATKLISEANFASGVKSILSVPDSTSFTYDEAGTQVASTSRNVMQLIPNTGLQYTVVPASELSNVNGAIVVDIHTKEYDFGDLSTEKVYDSVDIGYWTSNYGRLQIQAVFNGGSSLDTQTLDIAPSDSFTIDVDTADSSSLLTREFQATNINADRTSRVKGRVLQLRISDLAGYVLTSANNVLLFERDSAPGTVLTATVTAGRYATIVTLFDAIVSAMNTAAGASVFTHLLVDGSVTENLEATIYGGGIAWKFLITGGTAAQIAAAKALLAMVGYDTLTSAGHNGYSYAHQIALTNPPYANSTQLQLDTVWLHLTQINRRPT